MKRLEALQRKRGDGTGVSPRANAHVQPKKETLLVNRAASKPESMRWVGPHDDGTMYAAPGVQRWEAHSDTSARAGEIHEELEYSSDVAAYDTFSSDEPNSKLMRHVRNGSLRTGRNVARINNFMMSPPSSGPGQGASTQLPAGSALQAARAAGGSARNVIVNARH